MIRAAQYEDGAESYQATGTEGGGELQQLAAERLAAHRRRRAVIEGQAARARPEAAGLPPEAEPAAIQPDAARVRDAVVARYRESQSYREFLAEEAQRALERAQAEAEVATRNARAVAEAQRVLLEELEQWEQSQRKQDRRKQQERKKAEAEEKPRALAGALPLVPLQVRLHEPLVPAMVDLSLRSPVKAHEYEAEELAELDDEIEFRLAGGFEDLDMEVQPIQGNIIEFPRQLVASRKVRPRLAEGPLLEAPPQPQLRIFEVEPEQVAVEPEIVIAPEAPEWQSLRLGSEAFAHTLAVTQPVIEHQLHVATVGQRFMSATLDVLLVTAGLLGAAAVAAKVAGEPLRGAPLSTLVISAGGALLVFMLLYRLLFFTLNEATPGMRGMRLAFCTFDEQSPTRKAVRRRLFAGLLAVCPLGLGLVWMILDSDRLGWHDRMSHMYPRNY